MDLPRVQGSLAVESARLPGPAPTPARRIRVLHVVDKLTIGSATLHGVARLLSWWLPAYDPARFEVTLVSLRRPDAAGREMQAAGIDVRYLARARFDPRTLADLVRLARRERADLLHLHGYGSTTFGRLAARLLGLPSIVHEHMEDRRIPFYQRWTDRLLAGSTTYALAVSASVRRFMVGPRGIPAHLVETLYNGAPLAEHDRQRGERLRVREELELSPSSLVLATVGRLHEIKGHVYLLEALALVDRPELTLLVVGNGDLRTPLERRAQELGITDRVRFLGHRADVARVLSAVDVHVVASLSEGVPLTLFEAMAAGCANVATRVGGLAEIVADGFNGLLVPPADPPALAAAIARLADEPELRHALADNARATSRRYDIAECVRRQEQIYEGLVARGPRRS